MTKRLKAILQLLLGAVILTVLLLGVDKASILVEFTVDPVSVPADAAYTATIENTPVRFSVIEAIDRGTTLRAIQSTGRRLKVPSSGSLVSVTDTAPSPLQWSAATSRPYGRQLLLDALRSSADRWHLLLLALAGFFVSICLCVLRWGTLLRAQGFDFKFGQLLSLYFVGQFFNSFLPGGLSGDLVKAYYVVGETREKKAEAVATVFIDRVVGFFALVLLTVAVMCLRIKFFLGDPRMRVALVFNVALLAGVVGTLLAIFRRDALERSALFRRIERHTRLGGVIARAHTAFLTCLREPSTLSRTMIYSLGNHLTFVACTVAFLGAALGIRMTAIDYLSVFPVINAVAAIPLTPGGLGTREGAAIYLLGAMGVNEAKAILLSLLIYVALLFWSLVGGIVYMLYPRGRAPADIAGDAPAADR